MAKIIDSDAHVVEPRALWEEYVEPAFRDRIPKVVKDADGVDRFAVGQTARAGIYAPAAMCIPGGLSRPELAHTLSWDDLRPGSYDPHARIKDMDSEGIDVSFLFPSLALAYVAIREADLAAAACRAYNNWMADFCGAYPERLYSIAPVPLFEVDAAIAEMRRVVKEHGVRAVLVRPNPYGGRLLSDPAYDPFWRAAEDLDCTIAVHGAVGGDMPTAGFDHYRDFFQRMIISHPLEQQMACMTLICGGVLEKYPRLRVYPHYDCEFPGAVRELREHCAALDSETQGKIMGENAARCYGLV